MTDPGIAYLAIFLAFYFLPTLVAWWRGHRQLASILLLNLFLGWTVVGWVLALVWCASAQPRRPEAY
jgi:hypothetical protein